MPEDGYTVTVKTDQYFLNQPKLRGTLSTTGWHESTESPQKELISPVFSSVRQYVILGGDEV